MTESQPVGAPKGRILECPRVHDGGVSLIQIPESALSYIKTQKDLYFIENAERSAIKIGTSFNPRLRRESFQAANCDPLTLLGKIKHGEQLKPLVHEVFSDFRIRGEWFHYNPDLIDLAMTPDVPTFRRIVARTGKRIAPGSRNLLDGLEILNSPALEASLRVAEPNDPEARQDILRGKLTLLRRLTAPTDEQILLTEKLRDELVLEIFEELKLGMREYYAEDEEDPDPDYQFNQLELNDLLQQAQDFADW